MAYVCPCHGKAHMFDVALVCADGSAIGYHVDTYGDLVQSLIDISPDAQYLRQLRQAEEGLSGMDTAQAGDPVENLGQ